MPDAAQHVIIAIEWNAALTGLLRSCWAETESNEAIILIAPFTDLPASWQERIRVRFLSVAAPDPETLRELQALRTTTCHLQLPYERAYEFLRYLRLGRRIAAENRYWNGRSFRQGPYLQAHLDRLRAGISQGTLRCCARASVLLVLLILPLYLLVCLARGTRPSLRPLGECWCWAPAPTRSLVAQRWRWRCWRSYLWAWFCGRPMAPALPTDPQRILLISPDLIGDTLTVLPLVNALRERFPKAELHLLTGSKPAEAIDPFPSLDRIIRIDLPHPNSHHRDLGPERDALATLAELRRAAYDLAVVASFWPERSALATWIAARATLVSASCQFLVAGAVRVPLAETWIFARKMELLRPLGIEPIPPAYELPAKHSLRARQAAATGATSDDRPPWLAVHAQAPYHTRRWPASQMVALIVRLTARFRFRLLVLDAEDEFWGEALDELDGIEHRFVGAESLSTAIAALLDCRYLIANEGDIGHIAAGLNLPGTLLFTAKSPEEWRPASNKLRRVYDPMDGFPNHAEHSNQQQSTHTNINLDELETIITQDLYDRNFPLQAANGPT